MAEGPSKGRRRTAQLPLEGWKPYRPPWYPDRGEYHNPFATDPATIQQGGETYYSAWTKSLAPGELQRLIAESR